MNTITLQKLILTWNNIHRGPMTSRCYRWALCYLLVSTNPRKVWRLTVWIYPSQEAIQSVSESFYDSQRFVLFVLLRIYNHNYSRAARQSQFSKVLLPSSNSCCKFLSQFHQILLDAILRKEPKQFVWTPDGHTWTQTGAPWSHTGTVDYIKQVLYVAANSDGRGDGLRLLTSALWVSHHSCFYLLVI